MPPIRITKRLGTVLLLVGLALPARSAFPADQGMSTALGPAEGSTPAWFARQPASPPQTDVFRPFDPQRDNRVEQPAAPASISSGRNDTQTAGRDGPMAEAPGQQPVVPAVFQASGTADAVAPGQAPKEPATTALSARAVPEAPLPLKPRQGNRPESSTGPGRISGLSSLLTVGSSLAVVLGLFFLVAWAIRRAGPAGTSLLPGEVVELLGRAPLAGRQQVHLLRCGSKLVLVCLSPEGARTLTEITDPDEVTRLAGLCRQAHPNSATACFRQVFQQFHSEASGSKSFGQPGREDLQLTNPGVASAKGRRLEDDHA